MRSRSPTRCMKDKEIQAATSGMSDYTNIVSLQIVKALLQTEMSRRVRLMHRENLLADFSFRQIGDALMKKYYRARPEIAITPPPPPTMQSLDALHSTSAEMVPILGNDAKTQGKPNDVGKTRQDRQPPKKATKPRRPHLVLKRTKSNGGYS
ncbi:hypothetical protein K0M31_014087 [Melipona bicolor]|uniref:Uncharacterized protein n=1 Tax=Melipona bicolor TaxID=60889 RepID=A0AA40G7Y1_9HYME|nr:hypothetical protein K0M31_014087 [Melipona bicolor]